MSPLPLAVYNGQTVYYIPVHSCCDQWSDLYDSDGNIICHPDGGITGEGDFNCTDFSSLGGEIVWQDDR